MICEAANAKCSLCQKYLKNKLVDVIITDINLYDSRGKKAWNNLMPSHGWF
jgi:hypothetical protein